MADSLKKRLQNYFNIGVKTGKSGEEIFPTKPKEDDPHKQIPVKFDDYLKRLWNWWLTQTHDSGQTLKNRIDRYDDLDFMWYNDTVISMAADLYADEAAQSDTQEETVHVEARRNEIKKEIENLFEHWGITQQYIRDTAFNLALYGEAFDVNSTDNKFGVTEVVPIDVRTISDRFEFKASEVEKQMHAAGLRNALNTDPRLKTLARELKNVDMNYGEMFKSYLFGFKIGNDVFLPPWNVNHYRLSSKRSEFYPWGRSLFINLIGPFRQLRAAKNLMSMARAAKFPKEHFEVQTSESMTQSEKWDAVNEARQEYHNMGQNIEAKDQFSVGGELWTPEGLINHNLIENNMRLEDIADIELLRDDMIIGTRVPKGYLIVDRASFGTSGQALLQQFKPFGRAVYSIQSAILEQLTFLVRMHFLMAGKFDKEQTEFQLSMNFPVVEESRDRISLKSDTLRLANDVISNIQNAMGTRDGLPPEVIKSVFSQITFLDPEEVEAWIDQSAEALNTEDNNSYLMSSVDVPEDKKAKMMERIQYKDLASEAYFEALKKRNMKEGVYNNRHFYNSMQSTPLEEMVFKTLRISYSDGEIKG